MIRVDDNDGSVPNAVAWPSIPVIGIEDSLLAFMKPLELEPMSECVLDPFLPEKSEVEVVIVVLADDMLENVFGDRGTCTGEGNEDANVVARGGVDTKGAEFKLLRIPPLSSFPSSSFPAQLYANSSRS